MADTQTETSTDMRTIYPRLLRYTWRYKYWLGVAAVGMACYGGADVALVYLIKPLLDGSIVNRDPFLITWIPVFLLALFIIRGTAAFVSRYGMAWVANHVVFDVRGDILPSICICRARFLTTIQAARQRPS